MCERVCVCVCVCVSVYVCVCVCVYLSDRHRQGVDDLLVGHGHHTLSIDLDDAVPDANPPTLRDAPPHQAADLGGGGGGRGGTLSYAHMWANSFMCRIMHRF